MHELELIVDFNGLVLFDPVLLEQFYPELKPGENLYSRFTRTEHCDRVVRNGILVPIIGINDSVYKVFVREGHEDSVIPAESLVVSNAGFPLKIAGRDIISDMATLVEWSPGDGWQDLFIPLESISCRSMDFDR